MSNVHHPKHYVDLPARCSCGLQIECIQVVRHMNFNLGNVVKYIWRADSKGNDLEDLEKAMWYLNDELNRRREEAKYDTGREVRTTDSDQSKYPIGERIVIDNERSIFAP